MEAQQKIAWKVHSKHSDYLSASTTKSGLNDKHTKIRRRGDDTFDVVVGKELKKDKSPE